MFSKAKAKLSIESTEDIKFRGPLSYRHLRIIGWVFMALSMLSYVFKFGAGMIAQNNQLFTTMSTVFTYFTDYTMPLFLMANFAMILQHHDDFKHMIIHYLLLVGVMFFVINFAVTHYVLNSFMVIGKTSFSKAYEATNLIFTTNANTLLTANIFVDLLMCSLCYFFLFYNPKSEKLSGKNIYKFRLMIILPILYILGTTALKYCANFQLISLPYFLFPLLPSKPILSFLGFILIVIILKKKMARFMKKGGKEEDYFNYTQSNRSSLSFSIAASVSFLIVALIDLVCVVVLCIVEVALHEDNADVALANVMTIAQATGMGKTFCLILIIPFIMLFSYTRTYTDTKIDTLLPIVGIGVVAFTLIEGFYLVTIHADFIQKIRETLVSLSNALSEDDTGDAAAEGASEGASEGAKAALFAIRSFIH